MSSADEKSSKWKPFKELAIKLGLIERSYPAKREIMIGEPEKLGQENFVAFDYPTNKIVSSKYTAWNFVPKNLFEQFQRLANFYFGVVTIVLVVIDGPVSPATSIIPLVFVISTSMIKQGYEDWVRHKADSSLNNRKVKLIEDGFATSIKCEHIRVGDVVQVDANEEIPADLVFISSSEAGGTCYVTTANLDGETNLKEFVCHQETACLNNEMALRSLSAWLECEQPQVDLYKYNGRVTLLHNNQHIIKSLSAENLLLRGSSLKNTERVFGIAVYTGRDTKMALNSKFKPHKVSTVESILNKFLVILLLILILEAMFLAVMYFYFMSLDRVEHAWYLVDNTESVTAGSTINAFLQFSALINYIVPISLYVTMELQKFMGARFFGWDQEMYDKKTGQFAKANTSDLNEDLGQIQFLFADKTGTLTENDMMFRQCSIEGQLFHEVDSVMKMRSESGTKYVDVDHAEQQVLRDFFLKLALCHTVHVNRGVLNSKYKVSCRGGDREECIEYQASSPDEKALLEASFRQKVAFLGLFAGSEMRVLLAEKEEVCYKLLHVLEFDSTRKRMSVILEDSNGDVFLLCKGAETAVLNRCVSGPRDTVLHHVNMYAEEGLRTLVLAEKKLSKSDYAQVDHSLNKAKTALDGRDELLAAAFDHIETGMNCVGATAVEDQLQDQVPETIEYLRHAGIKVWILTGDKIETARNISYSCRHFKRGMRELSLLYQSNENDCREALEQINLITGEAEDRGEKMALVTDGQSLSHTMRDKVNQELFLAITLRCDAVLCCRLSPLQKSEVVSMIRYSPDRPVTLAIGDGANDVSMIQEAHVGIGIMGKEGTQAVRCSDYAFARFRFLQRALLVHGHWYYNRIAILVLYFFYKNMGFMNCQMFFQFYCAFSGQTLFHSYALTFFNVLFTSAPILIFGILEQNVPADKLIQYPAFYKDITCNRLLQWPHFFLWIFYCIWHSLVAYFGVLILLPDLGNWMFGLAVYHVLIIVMNVKLCLHTRLWGTMFIMSLVATIVFYYLVTSVYNLHYWSLFQATYEFYWMFFDTVSIDVLWAGIPIMMVVAFLPDLVAKIVSLVQQKQTPFSWNQAFARCCKKQVGPGSHSSSSVKNKEAVGRKVSSLTTDSFDNERYLRQTKSGEREMSPPGTGVDVDADAEEDLKEVEGGRRSAVLRGSREPSSQYAKPDTSANNSSTSAQLNRHRRHSHSMSMQFNQHGVPISMSMGERASIAPVSGLGDNEESAEEHFTMNASRQSSDFAGQEHDWTDAATANQSGTASWLDPPTYRTDLSHTSHDSNSDVGTDSLDAISRTSVISWTGSHSSAGGGSLGLGRYGPPVWEPQLGYLGEVDEFGELSGRSTPVRRYSTVIEMGDIPGPGDVPTEMSTARSAFEQQSAQSIDASNRNAQAECSLTAEDII